MSERTLDEQFAPLREDVKVALFGVVGRAVGMSQDEKRDVHGILRMLSAALEQNAADHDAAAVEQTQELLLRVQGVVWRAFDAAGGSSREWITGQP